MPKLCHHCGEEWDDKRSPSFRESCLNCGESLHCCANCKFHDGDRYEWCREPQAREEKPRDVTVANQCPWFVFGTDGRPVTEDRSSQAKAELAKIFGDEPPTEAREVPEWAKVEPKEPVEKKTSSLDDLFRL